MYVMADGRHFWRVIDNLMNNICKYAQPGTRVYVDLRENGGQVELIFRNTSRYPLNISSEELMERFVRGDESRNTRGKRTRYLHCKEPDGTDGRQLYALCGRRSL